MLLVPLSHPVPQLDVSFPEKLLTIAATIEASLKFTKYRLEAGFRPDPLGEPKCGVLLLRGGELRGGEWKEREGGERREKLGDMRGGTEEGRGEEYF